MLNELIKAAKKAIASVGKDHPNVVERQSNLELARRRQSFYDQVEKRAYTKWLNHKSHGRDVQDWIEAEQEVRQEMDSWWPPHLVERKR